MATALVNPFQFIHGRRRRRGPPKPSSIPGLVAWRDIELSALWQGTDGTTAATNVGLLGRIDDLTSSGLHLQATADAARPDYFTNMLELGVPGAFFAGSAERMVSPGLAAHLAGNPPSFTVFVVWWPRRPLSSTAGVVWGAMTDGGALASDPNIYIRCSELNTSAASPIIRFARRNAAGVTTNTDSAAGFGGSGRPLLLTSVVNGDTSRTTYQNGVSAASVSAAIGQLPLDENDHYGINTLWDGTNTLVNGSAGWFFADCVYSRALSTAEVAKLNRYYAHRLNWSRYVHAATPVKTFVFGDSHSEGHNDQAPSANNNTATYWNRLFRKLPFAYTAKPMTRALSGARFTLSGADNDIREQYETAKTLIDAGSLVVICGGQNDIGDNNPTTGVAPTTEAEVEEMIDFEIMGEGAGAEATNFKTCINDATETRDAMVVALTVPPRGNLSDILDHGIAYMGERQKEYACRFDRTEVYDWWDALRTAATNELNQAAYESAEDDEIHLNSAAHELAANGVASALTRLQYDPRTHANLVRWWSARQGSRFADGGAIGDTGTELVDRSDTGDDATQGTADNRPTWEADITNHRPVVRFDGTNDALAFTELALTEWTLILVFKATDSGPIIGGSGTSEVAAGEDSISVVSEGDVGISFTGTLAEYDVVVIRSSGECWINGVAATVGIDEGFSASHALTLDEIGHHTSNFDGDLGDLLIFDAALSATDINNAGRYIAQKYAKTWTNIA